MQRPVSWSDAAMVMPSANTGQPDDLRGGPYTAAHQGGAVRTLQTLQGHFALTQFGHPPGSTPGTEISPFS